MREYSTIIAVVAALGITGLIAFVVDTPRGTGAPTLPAWVTNITQGTTTAPAPQPHAQTPVVDAPATGRLHTTPGVERWYTHDAPRFSFRLPDGFTAPDIDTGERTVSGVLVSDTAGTELVVYVYPIASGTRIDAATIKSYFSDAQTSNIRETVIGTVVRAFEFASLQPDGTTMLNVWAAYNGYVYTLTTSTENEDLLNFVIGHWFFTPPTPSAPQKK